MINDPDNARKLSTYSYSFSFGVARNGKPHNTTINNQKRFDDWGTNALAWDNKTEEKVLYLTFDCGYKYKYLVVRMLDTLKEKKVPATFFCTMPYLKVLGVHNYLRVNFGYECKYFRFPTGRNSESAIDLVNNVGYRSVFWSIAHADWDPEKQPGEEVAFNTITSRLHPGAVILLHSTSPDNAAMLGRIIDYAREQGYEFRSLDDYPGWK